MRIFSTLLILLSLTISTTLLAQPMSGTYTIGGTSANFPNLQTAIDSLTSKGMSGSVTLNLSSGFVDTTQVRIDKAISGLALANPLIIQTVPGSAARATLLFKNKSTKLEFAFYSVLNYVFIKNMDIIIDSKSYRYTTALFMERGNIDNCNLKGVDFTSSTSHTVQMGKTGSITNCKITGGTTGIHVFSSSYNMVISGNTISGFYEYGINIINANRLTISKNKISRSNHRWSAVYAYVNSSTFSQNQINTSGPGLLITGDYNNVINNMIIAGNYGIKMLQLDSSYVENNSLRVTIKGGHGVEIESSSFNYGLYFRNNCIMHSDSGKMIHTSGSFQSNVSKWDNNNWFTQGSQFAQVRNGSSTIFYNSISDWRTFSKLDASSLTIDPEYYSNKDLHAQSLAMDNTGVPTSIVSTDIDGDTRSTSTPDIGADEYSVANDNVMLSNLEIVDACGSSGQLFGTIRNSGLNNITAFEVEWSAQNENTTTPKRYAFKFRFGTLLPGEDTTLLLGSYQLNKGDTTSIVAFTFKPNGNADSRTYGDTNQIELVQPQMTGTYTIGGTSPDFVTLKEALDDLKNRGGICDEVIFNIRSGTYTEDLKVTGGTYTWGLSSNKRLIFQSDPSNTTRPIISSGGTTEQLKCSSKYVTIKGLEFIISTPKMYNNVASLGGEDIIIDSCVFIGVPHTKTDDKGGMLSTSVNRLQVLNSEFKFGAFGISSSGNSVLLENNRIDTSFQGGIFISGDSNTVRANTINLDARYYSQKGIRMKNSKSTIIEKNRIYIDKWLGGSSYRYALDIESYGADSTINIIKNNNIIADDVSIRLRNSSYIHILNNSARSSHSVFSISATVIEDGHFKIQNNLFVSERGPVTSLPSSQNSKFILEMDYNNFYSHNNNSSYFQYRSGGAIKSYKTIKEWNTITGYDANSLQEDPVLFSTTELIPDNITMDNKGKVLPGVTKDINGNLRSTTTPDIGAYEFTGSKDYTSIESQRKQHENELLTVFPNPSKNVIWVSLPNSFDNAELIIIDAMGRKVFEESLIDSGNSKMIELEGIANGVYTIRLKSSGQWHYSTFIKN